MFGHNNSQQGFYIKVLQNIWLTVIRLYSLAGRRGSQVRLMLMVFDVNQLLNVLYVVLVLMGFQRLVSLLFRRRIDTRSILLTQQDLKP